MILLSISYQNIVMGAKKMDHRDVSFKYIFVCLFVFVALHPKSTAMVIAGRSVHLTTLEQAVYQ